MLSIKKSIRSLLVSSTDVSALVGDRIFAQKIPQKFILPSVVISGISSIPQHSHVSSIDYPTAILADGRIQIDCFASLDAVVQDLSDKIRKRLDTYTGTQDGIFIGAILLNNSLDIYDAPEDGSDVGVYRVMMDFQVMFTTERPTLI